MALFSHDGFLFLLRWFHFLAGVAWIGMLWYFNFVQGSFFAEADAATKSNCIQKLVPRALWWFRWGAMFTFITGWATILTRYMEGPEIFRTTWGAAIMAGSLLGTFMWFNVWFVIWPAQKVVIASTKSAASGGSADPSAAARGARALVASRTNTMFSIPMLFMMGAASHLPFAKEEPRIGPWMGAATVIILLLEANALKGKTGPLTTVKGVIHCGIGLTIVFYALMEILL